MKNTTEAIAQIIDERQVAGETTSPAHIAAIVMDRYPDLFLDEARSAYARDLTRRAKGQLSERARQRQQAFEGMDLPQWYTFLDAEGEYSYVPLTAATLSHSRMNVEIKRRNVVAAQTELRVAQAQDRQFWSVDGAHGEMLILDAVGALS